MAMGLKRHGLISEIFKIIEWLNDYWVGEDRERRRGRRRRRGEGGGEGEEEEEREKTMDW